MGFWGSGFRGFRIWGFGVPDIGVEDLGFWGSGFRVELNCDLT